MSRIPEKLSRETRMSLGESQGAVSHKTAKPTGSNRKLLALTLTSPALELDAVNDAYAYFFVPSPISILTRCPKRKREHCKRRRLDREHREPLVQLLLAQIYEAKHDPAGAASHLQHYLKAKVDSTGVR